MSDDARAGADGVIPIGSKLARKMVTGISTDPTRQALVIRARGPLDVDDVEIEFPYVTLLHSAGQLIVQRAEVEIAALRAGGIAKPS
jgi:hypothetical protein